MQQNLYTGERYELTAEHLRQLEALVVATVHPERYLLLVETGDEVLDYRASGRALRRRAAGRRRRRRPLAAFVPGPPAADFRVRGPAVARLSAGA